MALTDPISAGAAAAFAQVVLIDLTLAGDNAVAVGMTAAGLPPDQRRKAITLGMAGAVVMLVGFALITTQLLKVVGLPLAGGILLLWVCWKMWRDLRQQRREAKALVEAATAEPAIDPDQQAAHGPPKTLNQALVQILVADLAMSLDNVLAVAGAARKHPVVLAVGLVLSITITGLAANLIAKLLHRARWIGYLGLAIVIYVACTMIWEGLRTVAIDTGEVKAYNAAMPDRLDIQPDEAARRKAK